MSETFCALPYWQSHKRVHGDKIVRAWPVGVDARVDGNDSGHRWELACGATIVVSLDLLSRVPFGAMATGGYYVLYQDGYESWSPAKAFEEGYDRI